VWVGSEKSGLKGKRKENDSMVFQLRKQHGWNPGDAALMGAENSVSFTD